MKFQFAHEFDASPSLYWDVFFSDEYNQELYQRLRMRSRKVLDYRVENSGAQIYRSQLLEPNLPLPSWARSVVQDVSYIEHNHLDRDRSVMEVRIEPNRLKERFQWSGIYTVKPIGPNRCRRVYEGDVKISLPLIGGKFESLIVEQMKQAEAPMIQVTQAWLARKQA